MTKCLFPQLCGFEHINDSQIQWIIQPNELSNLFANITYTKILHAVIFIKILIAISVCEKDSNKNTMELAGSMHDAKFLSIKIFQEKFC